mmetsp:Transcript_9648/g.14358  ORF Transcript_9648/g.14358 Transcript_9648/m.14358 type:complete len:680 (+) Transcript_9648:26-2065(+)
MRSHHAQLLLALFHLPNALAVRRYLDDHAHGTDAGKFAVHHSPTDALATETMTGDAKMSTEHMHHDDNNNRDASAGLRWQHRRLLTPPTREDHLVTSLPLLNLEENSLFSDTKHYAGHIPLDYSKDDKAFFYWLFENPNADSDDIPLLIWLNGGPACSSMDGLFLENGPFRLDLGDLHDTDNMKIHINQHSWHNAPAHVVYIDQPVGTGLSYTKSETYCKNDLEINIDFYAFLQNFIQVHKELLVRSDGKTRKVFFSGESHAGHYIPSMMKFILDRNDDIQAGKASASGDVFISLEGAAIGNGWVDPFHQYAGAEASYGVGLIDSAQKRALDEKEIECQNGLKEGKLNNGVCFELIDVIVDQSNGGDHKSIVSVYDNRRYEPRGSFPPGKKDVERYLGGSAYSNSSASMKKLSDKVLQSIHATEAAKAGQHYLECTNPPYFALKHQDGLGVTNEVTAVLERGVKILFFNGMNDIICNHVGNERLIENLSWSKIEQWKEADRYIWRAGNKPPAGYMKEFQNLFFLKIREAGHMVPMDQPELSLKMMKIFLSGGSFKEVKQSLGNKDQAGECASCSNCFSSPTVPIESQGSYSDVDRGHGNASANNDDDIRISRDHFVVGAWISAIVVSGIALFVLKRNYSGISSKAPIYQTPAVANCVDDIEEYSDDPPEKSTISRLRID